MPADGISAAKLKKAETSVYRRFMGSPQTSNALDRMRTLRFVLVIVDQKRAAAREIVILDKQIAAIAAVALRSRVFPSVSGVAVMSSRLSFLWSARRP